MTAPESPPLILIADDEAVVRDVAARILKREGYETITARDGHEALRVLRERAEEVALVFLDYSMDGFDHGEQMAAFREMCGDKPIVLSSGFSEAETLSNCAGAPVPRFVPKPFSVESLVAAVTGALQGGDTQPG